MNFEKVVSGFFIVFAMALSFGFFYGEIDNILMHSKYLLFFAIVVNLISMVLKLGDKTQIGSVIAVSNLVASILLVSSATVWSVASYAYVLDINAIVTIVSLSGGALLANIVSVVLYIGETLKSKR